MLSNGTPRHHAAYTVLSPLRSGAGVAERPNLLSTRSSRSGESSSVLVDLGMPPSSFLIYKDSVPIFGLSAQTAVWAMGKAAACCTDTTAARNLALGAPPSTIRELSHGTLPRRIQATDFSDTWFQ